MADENKKVESEVTAKKDAKAKGQKAKKPAKFSAKRAGAANTRGGSDL